jgi:hypothetical protein
MIIDPEKTPMMDILKVAFKTAEIAGREDLMVRCQYIADAAHALDNLYKASPSDAKAELDAIANMQEANRRAAEIEDIDDYMQLCIEGGIQHYGFMAKEFEDAFRRYVDWDK